MGEKRCLWCGTELEQPMGSGRPRKTCGGNCRIAAHRWRQKPTVAQVALLRRATDAGFDEAAIWKGASRDGRGGFTSLTWKQIAPWKDSPLRV